MNTAKESLGERENACWFSRPRLSWKDLEGVDARGGSSNGGAAGLLKACRWQVRGSKVGTGLRALRSDGMRVRVAWTAACLLLETMPLTVNKLPPIR